MKYQIFLILFISLVQSLSSICQSKIYTIGNILDDSNSITIKFHVIAKDSISYPLDANPAYINITKMENNFFNIVLEKLNNKNFSFDIYFLDERIQYYYNTKMFGKIAKSKVFDINRKISLNPNVISSGIYRCKLTLDLMKFNKGYKKYQSEYIYFEVKDH